ncbi:MAG: phospho-N-acetylmuramoyl-pentapeptide-transferase [Chloroflexi bacterium]|nr:phospho-N-acetylmuramoyl-pentapeptide-transferase [Chloroflexota bacterium]MCL5075652.1 phospho-N-acetylmuramoyl-pentapeptide-transferase [Chloroflexota bacterium]
MTPLLLLVMLPASFLLAIAWGPHLIALLRARKAGKQIRLDGPSTHITKAGTPTMGGWLIILTSAALSMTFIRHWEVALSVLVMVTFGLIGSIDDYANLRSYEGLGLPVRYKFLWHMVIALVVSVVLYIIFGKQGVSLPGLGTLTLGWWYVPLAALAIFGTASGVNEIDGLDGLAGGTVAIAYSAYLIIALLQGQVALAALCASVIGATLGFLWFNVYPAQVFMGDAGSLALGAGLAMVSLLTGWVLLLPVIGILFVIELVSVIVQVAYFRATGGKRILRMSPIHHHLELSGWGEAQIVQRFWLLGAVAAAIGVGLALIR